jgi:hypothetical protein
VKELMNIRFSKNREKSRLADRLVAIEKMLCFIELDKVDRQTDRWVDGWMGGWMGGWMDGWVMKYRK